MDYVSGKLKAILSWRGPYIVECLLYLGLLTALNILFGGGERFLEVHPHPFWAIVLLVTVQYGINQGLIAALLSTLFLYMGNVPEQKFNQDFYDYLFELCKTPLLWFVTAVILGGLRDRLVFKKNVLQKKYNALKKRESEIVSAYYKLKDVKETLELRLAGQLYTASSTYQAVLQLETESTDQRDLLENVPNIVKTVMDPKKFSVYALSGDGLHLITSVGWDARENYVDFFAPSSPIYQKLIDHRKLLSLINADDERVLAGQGVLAAPLVDPRENSIIGMIKIESLNFIELTLSNIEAFKALCEWIGVVYANAGKLQSILENSIRDTENGWFSYIYFQQMITLLVRVSKQINFNICKLTIHVEGLIQAEKKLKLDFSQQLEQCLIQNISSTCSYYNGSVLYKEFIVVMLNHAESKAHQLTKDIQDFFAKNKIYSEFILSFSIDEVNEDDLLNLLQSPL
jgi:hypothetical protein